MKILLIFLILSSCMTPKVVIKEKIKFIDYKTYTEWGTTRLVPIGRRLIPTEDEICRNPLWVKSKKCKEYQNVMKK